MTIVSLKIGKDRLGIAPLAGAIIWGALSGITLNFYRRPWLWLVLPITLFAAALFAAIWRRVPGALRIMAQGQPGATVAMKSNALDVVGAMGCLFTAALIVGMTLRLLAVGLAWIGS